MYGLSLPVLHWLHQHKKSHMQYVGGSCLGILMQQKNSRALVNTMGCFFLIRDGRKETDFKMTLILGSTMGCVLSVLCLSMPLIHKSVQTLLNSRATHNLLHSQTIQQKLTLERKKSAPQQKNVKRITFLCQKVKHLV